tara:strand:- start:74 stop:442 length:369 start_codon:yes stop_codon:yes gene_type:complete
MFKNKTQEEYYKNNRDDLVVKMKEYRNKPESKAKARERAKGIGFVVYSHTNNKGDVYIGEGRKRRAIDFTKVRRSKSWNSKFNRENTVVKILGYTDTKIQSKRLESKLITQIGINNLTNKFK